MIKKINDDKKINFQRTFQELAEEKCFRAHP